MRQISHRRFVGQNLMLRATFTSLLACGLALGAALNNRFYAQDKPATARPGDLETSRHAGASVPGHRTLRIEGWTVHVSDELRRSDSAATAAALRLLEAQLKKVVRVIPPEPRSLLRKVPIWLSPLPKGFKPTGEYHPDVGWLKTHDRDPAMAKAIQFTNIPIFAAEVKRMPMLVLHELAHAYHDRVIGFDEPRIVKAYEQAVQSGTYDRVEEASTGTMKRAYALTDHKEYFAELTESYFGANDFLPFNRAQLQRHDPAMYELLGELWKVTDPARAN
ncbi:MAG: hypothetical protein AB7U73_01700 [Pirellulales bacterium]